MCLVALHTVHLCCLKGQVLLPPIVEDVPLPNNADSHATNKAAAVKSICDMWKSTDDMGKTLRRYALQVNNALAIASITAASEVVPQGVMGTVSHHCMEGVH